MQDTSTVAAPTAEISINSLVVTKTGRTGKVLSFGTAVGSLKVRFPGNIQQDINSGELTSSPYNFRKLAKLQAFAPRLYEVLSFTDNMLGYKNDQNQLTETDIDLHNDIKELLKKFSFF